MLRRWMDRGRAAASVVTPATAFRVVLLLAASGLALWLVFAADKPWTFDPTKSSEWRLRELVAYYSFWAGLANLVLLVVLAVAAPIWAGTRKPVAALLVQRAPVPERWFWPLVAGAMAVCAICAGLRMNHGFDQDEDYSVRRSIAGPYQVGADGMVSLDPVSWQQTFFYYRKPNNHVLHSIACRLAWNGWMAVAPEPRWQMREWVIRVPAFLGGLGTLCALALLLRRMVSPQAGVIAAWLLAIHPWFIRYASEARGYSMAMMWIAVMLLLWLRAMEHPSWMRWAAWALSQVLLFMSYPGALYVLVILNALTLARLVASCLRMRDGTPLWRWLVVNLLAAGAVLQMTLPLVPQLRAYMATSDAARPLNRDWYLSTGGHFLAGTPWEQVMHTDWDYLEVKSFALEHPVFFGVLLAGLLGLGIVGYARMWIPPRAVPGIPAATLLVPGFMALAVAHCLHQWLFEWYLIYLLPGFVAGIAVGADVVGRRLLSRRPALGALAAGVTVVVAYAVFSSEFRSALCAQPFDACKRVGHLLRGGLALNDPAQNDILTGSFPPQLSYSDPRAVLIHDPAEFIALMRRADAERKPLTVAVSRPWSAAFRSPELWRIVNESGLFRDFVIFFSFDGTMDWKVARYAPGAVESFDYDAFSRGRSGIPDPERAPLVHPNRPEIFP